MVFFFLNDERFFFYMYFLRLYFYLLFILSLDAICMYIMTRLKARTLFSLLILISTFSLISL